MSIFTPVSSLQSFLASQLPDSYVGYSKSKKAYCSLTKDEITKQEQDKRRARRFAKNIEGILTSSSHCVSKVAALAIQESQFKSLMPTKYLAIQSISGKERWVPKGKRKIKAISAGDALLLLSTLKRQKKQHVRKDNPNSTQSQTRILKSSVPQATVTKKRCFGQIVVDDERPSTSSAPKYTKYHRVSCDSDDDIESTSSKGKKALKKRGGVQTSASLSSVRLQISNKSSILSSDSKDNIETTESKGKKTSKKRANVQPSSQATLTEELSRDISDISTKDESDTRSGNEQELARGAAEMHVNPPVINPRRRVRAGSRRIYGCIGMKYYKLTIRERRAIENALKVLPEFSFNNIHKVLKVKYPHLELKDSILRNEMNRYLKTKNGQDINQCYKKYDARLMQAEADEQQQKARIKQPHVPHKKMTSEGRLTLQKAIKEMPRLHIQRLEEKCFTLGFPTTRGIITHELKHYAEHLKIPWEEFSDHYKEYSSATAENLAIERTQLQKINLRLSKSKI